MLFQIDLTGASPSDVFAEFWSGTDAGEEVRERAEALVRGVEHERQRLDSVVAAATEHWRIERMAVVDRNVLRMAVFEMLDDPDVPRVVAIDEAIEIARKYGSEESAAFINGILDAVLRRVDRGEIPFSQGRGAS